METLDTAGALMELVRGANWMRAAIPGFSELTEPLHKLLEAQYSLHNSLKESRLCNRPLSAWRYEHPPAFTPLFQAITQKYLWLQRTLENACTISQTHHPHIGLAC